MTDAQMDERLRAAGERFRDGTTDAPAAVDVGSVATPSPSPRRPRRSRLLLAAAAAAVVALVVGLTVVLRGSTHSTPPSVDNAGLVGNVWLLSANGEPSTAALYVTRSGELVADDECELISGSVQIDGDRLTVSNPVVRSKPCVDQGFAPGFNGLGMRVLRDTATFRIDSHGMTITRGGVGSLRFVLAQTPNPPPSLDIPTLTGTDWVAPNGTVLHIGPSTGELQGGWCDGRAHVDGSMVRFAGCGTGQRAYEARVAGTTLTLLRSPSHGRVTPMPDRLVFHWRPLDASIVNPMSLAGRTWQLQSVIGSPASSGSLRIARGTALVDDGCTKYRRSVRVDAGTFAIAGPAPTHACTDQATTADSFVFEHPATWAVRDDKLIVYGGGSQTFALVYGATGPNTPTQNPALLLAHRWQVDRITFGGGRYADGAPSPDPAVLTFSASGYTVAHLCYDTAGSARRLAGIVQFAGARTTDVHSCPAQPDRRAYAEATQAVDAITAVSADWHLDGSRLTLTDNDGSLELHAVDPDPAALTGSRWQLTRTVRQGVLHAAIGDVTLRFPNDSTLAITRCYTSQADTEVSTTRLSVRDLHVTRALPCPSGPPGTQEENDFVDRVLSGSLTWSVTGDRLVLTNAGDALVFARR